MNKGVTIETVNGPVLLPYDALVMSRLKYGKIQEELNKISKGR